MEKKITVTVGVDKDSVQETEKKIGEIYAKTQEAFRETKVIVDATTTATKDAGVEMKEFLKIATGTVVAAGRGFSLGSKVGGIEGGLLGGLVAGGGYLSVQAIAKAMERDPAKVPFSDLEAIKSGNKYYGQDKEQRARMLEQFSDHRIQSELDQSTRNYELIQEKKKAIASLLDKLDVNKDMGRVLTLKGQLEALSIQEDVEFNFIRAIADFRKEKQKRVGELEKIRPVPISSKPTDARTLPAAEVEKLPLATASEVANQIRAAFKAPKLATVEIANSFTQAGKQGGKSFFELINLSGKLKTTLASGLDVVSQKIQQGVHGKLVEAFNGAHSVAQQFFADVLSQLAAVAAKAGSSALIAGLLSVIPGVGTFAGLFKTLTGFAGGGIIPEPVLGIGLHSGTGYTFGERGPEYVMPNSQLQSARFSSNGSNQLAQRIAGLEKAIAGGTWRISGRDIVYSYDRNSYGVNQRRF